MNTIEVTMPEGLEAEVFDGLTDKEKEVITTQAKCDSLMAFIMSQCQRPGTPPEVADVLGNMAADLFSQALAYAMDVAEVDSEERANELIARGMRFSQSARETAEGAVKKVMENTNAQPE